MSVFTANVWVDQLEEKYPIFFLTMKKGMIQTNLYPREKIAKMACLNKPNQLHCIYKPY